MTALDQPIRKWERELVFPAGRREEEGLRELSLVLADLDSFLASIPELSQQSALRLRLVCDELGSNLIRHARRDLPTRWRLAAAAERQSLRLEIMDDGEEFDPFAETAAPYIGTDLELREVGGLGLYLIRDLFPHMRHRREGGWNVSEVDCPFVPDGV